MVTLNEAVNNVLRPTFCALSRPFDNFAGLYGNYLRSVPSIPTRDLAGEALQRARGARNAFCSETPDNALTGAPIPFQGGQCPGELYQFTRQGTINGSPIGGQSTTVRPGPLRIVKEDLEPQGTRAVVVDGNGDRLPCAATTFPDRQADCIISNVFRVDGQPDDCGNPPRDAPTYDRDDFTQPVDVTFDDDNTGNPVTISPTLTFSPVFVDAEANFNIPFNLSLSPEINLSGTLDLSTGDTTFNNTNNVDIDIPDGPFEVPQGEDIENTGLKIIGARVVSSVSNTDFEGTNIVQSPPAQALNVPRLGTLFFYYSLPDGSVVQGDDLDVKVADQVFWSDRVCVGASFTPQGGVSSTVSLIVVTAESCDPCSC